jgi:integrase
LLSRLRVGLPIYEDEGTALRKVFEDWLDSRTVTPSSYKSDQSIWSIWWSPWDTLTPQVITSQMIRQRLSERDVSPKTKRNARNVLSAVLNHADVSPNPCASIRIKSGQKAPIDRYRPGEVDALLSALEGEARVYFTLLAATGLRPSEALALEWCDWDGERLSVSKGIVRGRLRNSTKTHVRRRVYVPQWARDTLNQHVTRFQGGYIFQNTEGNHHCDTNDLNAAWRKAHQKARVPYRIPYTLRHTRAAELLSQSAQPALAAKELGHSTAMFLGTYSEWIDEYAGGDVSVLEGRTQTARKARKGEGGQEL